MLFKIRNEIFYKKINYKINKIILTKYKQLFTILLEMMKMIENIWNTKQLIQQIQKTNILNYEDLKVLAYKIEMLDKNYTSELKQIIIDKADIIKLNNLKEKYNNDEKIKKELLVEIKEIASCYGIINGN